MTNSIRKFTLRSALTLALALTVGVPLNGCSSGSSSLPTLTPGTYRSAPLTLGGGTARTYVTIGSDGAPTEAGVILTEAALTNLPDQTKVLYEIPMPAEASTTCFNHIELRYWSHGHDPDDLFMHTHFDFIPFMMTQEQRDAITAVGADRDRVLKPPVIEAIPIGYSPIPDVDEFYAEPRYGTRYFDVARFTPVLNHEQPYTTTLFYGYYDGNVNFLEIPLTFDFLMEKTNTTYPIPLPRTLPKAAYYPTQYRIRFDSATGEYLFALEGMVKR